MARIPTPTQGRRPPTHPPTYPPAGFDSNSVWGEKEVMGIMETHAYGIRGLPVPNPTAPGTYVGGWVGERLSHSVYSSLSPKYTGRPELIEGSNAHSIAWRGAVGAQWYEIERQEVEATPSSPPSLPATGAAPSFLPAVATKQVEEEGEKGWVKLADKLYDSTNPYIPFKDVTAHPGKTYRYRIYAVNEAGRGVPSPSLAIATPLASARASSSTTGESSSNNTTTASLTHEVRFSLRALPSLPSNACTHPPTHLLTAHSTPTPSRPPRSSRSSSKRRKHRPTHRPKLLLLLLLLLSPPHS